MSDSNGWSRVAAEQPDVQVVSIAAIRIGERVRQDLGDLNELAASIGDIGLLHFPVVTDDMDLCAGERRVRACRKLGWTEVPVHVVHDMDDLAARFKIEEQENVCRKDLTPLEMAARAKRLRVILAPEAAQRKAASQVKPGQKLRAKKLIRLPSGLPSGGESDDASKTRKSPGRNGGAESAPPFKTRQQVAAMVGTSHDRLKKIEAVIEAAENDPHPEVRRVAGKAREEMDRTGKVEAAYRQVVEAQQQAKSGNAGGNAGGSQTVKRQKRPSSRRRPARSIKRYRPPHDLDGDMRVLSDGIEALKPVVDIDLADLAEAMGGGFPSGLVEVVSDVDRWCRDFLRYRPSAPRQEAW
jgi:ParB family chromosome partitioning protein